MFFLFYFILLIFICAKITKSYFTNCSSNWGGVINFSGNRSDEKRTLIIRGCIFEDCFVSDEDNSIFGGGGIMVTLSGIANLEIGNDEENNPTKFKNCSAGSEDNYNGYGGGIFLSLIYANDLCPNFVFDINIEFENCNALYGKNIYINSSEFDCILKNESFKFEKALLNGEDLIGYDETSDSNVELKEYLCELIYYSEKTDFPCENGCVKFSKENKCLGKCPNEIESNNDGICPCSSFNKDEDNEMNVCGTTGCVYVSGTSCTDNCSEPILFYSIDDGICTPVKCENRKPFTNNHSCQISNSEECYG
jgi:hypothetical protein